MDERRLELKVGALVLASFAAAFILLMLMGEVSFKRGTALLVDFSHTGNVVKNAPVKLGGVVVGKVDSVELLAARNDVQGHSIPVQMKLAVSPEAAAALKSDAAVTVSSVGPLGESYLELWPGSAATSFDSTQAIRGTDAPRLDVVSNRLAKFLDVASQTLEKDPEAMSRFIGGIGGLSTTFEGVLTENRAELKILASELAGAARDLRIVAATARNQLEAGGQAHALLDDAAATAKLLRKELPELSHQASAALGGLARVSAPLTEDDGQKLKSLIATYQSVGNKAETVAARADRLLSKLEAGEGTLGAAMKDPAVFDELKVLLTDVRKHPWKLLWKD
jgi:phospholipid/cholesterol/gamma-HCH transport system substrate-binding protein